MVKYLICILSVLTVLLVNKVEIELDVPAMIADGKTFVPLRFVAEELGVQVDFVSETVIITPGVSNIIPSVTNITAELLTGGMWHGHKSVGAGYSDRYFFRPDGTFIFINDDWNLFRTREYSGNWTLANYMITADETMYVLMLRISEKVITMGGTRIHNGIFYEYPGGEDVTLVFDPPFIIEYILRDVGRSFFDYSIPDSFVYTIFFNNTQYFLFGGYREEHIR